MTVVSSTKWMAADHDLKQGRFNWSGSLRFRPARIEAPADESAVKAIVEQAIAQHRTLRPIGSGHSSTGIIATDDILVSLENITGIHGTDEERLRARVGAGSVLTDLGEPLHEAGLTMPNFGDVATQTAAGALGTGTHGSGRDLQNLSMIMVGGRLVTGTGEVKAFSAERDPDLLRALRVSFGTLGILTEIEMQLDRTYDLHRREWCTRIDECLDRLDAMSRENRNFDFYWYPRSGEAKLRCLNERGKSPDYSAFARLVMDRIGPPYKVIPQHSGLPHRFDEMEYALPAEAAPECFRIVRKRVKDKWRRSVGWRLLYRFIKSDDTWLSEAHGRETATISLHQNSSLPFSDYFADIEPIFREYGGRPHWAKKHSMRAEQLAPLYPQWERFIALRREFDPHGVFLTPYLRELLGIEGAA